MLVAALVVAATLALGAEPPPSFEGTWVLDVDASSDPTPALERLGVGWVVRKAARRMGQTTIITRGEGRLRVEVRSLLANKTVDVVLDGRTPTSDDLLGRPFSYTSRVEGGKIVSQGTVLSTENEKIPLDMERVIDANGRMVVRIVLRPETGPPLVITRVGRRR